MYSTDITASLEESCSVMSQSGFCEDWDDVSVDGSDEEPPVPVSAPTVIGSWSNLPRPDLIVPEAFVSNPLCTPMQIATATDEKLDTVLRRFNDIFNCQR